MREISVYHLTSAYKHVLSAATELPLSGRTLSFCFVCLCEKCTVGSGG